MKKKGQIIDSIYIFLVKNFSVVVKPVSACRNAKYELAFEFPIVFFIKDMTIATEEAKDVNLNMNIVNNVLSMYQSLDKEGYGELGTQALIKYYQKQYLHYRIKK